MKNRSIDLRERLIVALDFDRAATAREMVRRCEAQVGFFKVGLELFMVDWFATVDWLIARGHKVMLDLKFYDIPETVKRAVAQVNDRGVSLLTIHGDRSIIEAAVAARGDMKLLAVTVLTSFSAEDLRELGMAGDVVELVRRRARIAVAGGCDGVVSSAREARALRGDLGECPVLVTPGIRPAETERGTVDDQKRVMTAGQAISGGADYLVVGRPITRATDPQEVIARMHEEIAAALAE
ncbi:orotidine-5'-phosphate decarboxylase [Desulfofustis glycolicus]|uniref:Orotidine 5'-phosphate decarboxylase n=1 Tax=Desulfofustis glycolicus DSM 9705 TaxID=1121409 RepID=A0A1M5WLQ7_9BACT|nr:orotidine-5'-phosphate decarboxylase [Desulfofustis glycolicus]MCB2217115.1 orotidine-5'-phosphate decarboxylase [Desulfobulbaceae bacterium]SHH88429.1 orotidine-5'-phosphate decarboxylase [Desulfofustis glycolicus DSM 9705]